MGPTPEPPPLQPKQQRALRTRTGAACRTSFRSKARHCQCPTVDSPQRFLTPRQTEVLVLSRSTRVRPFRPGGRGAKVWRTFRSALSPLTPTEFVSERLAAVSGDGGRGGLASVGVGP